MRRLGGQESWRAQAGLRLRQSLSGIVRESCAAAGCVSPTPRRRVRRRWWRRRGPWQTHPPQPLAAWRHSASPRCCRPPGQSGRGGCCVGPQRPPRRRCTQRADRGRCGPSRSTGPEHGQGRAAAAALVSRRQPAPRLQQGRSSGRQAAEGSNVSDRATSRRRAPLRLPAPRLTLPHAKLRRQLLHHCIEELCKAGSAVALHAGKPPGCCRVAAAVAGRCRCRRQRLPLELLAGLTGPALPGAAAGGELGGRGQAAALARDCAMGCAGAHRTPSRKGKTGTLMLGRDGRQIEQMAAAASMLPPPVAAADEGGSAARRIPATDCAIRSPCVIRSPHHPSFTPHTPTRLSQSL